MPYKDKEKELEKHRKWQKRHRPELAVKQAAYYRKNPVIYLLNACRSRARKSGVDFNLTKEDIRIPEVCPVLGIKLEHGTKGFHGTSPSIDRLNPAKGYIRGNVVVMSFRANRIKNDSTLEELKRLVAFLEKVKSEGGHTDLPQSQR